MGSFRRIVAFAAFTAIFAVLVVYIFWGSWSASLHPVMPDARVVFPAKFADRLAEVIGNWLSDGRFAPFDLRKLLFGTWMVELQYGLAAYFAALGMAYFLRGRGCGLLPAYGAGLLLGFCGYWFSLFSAGHVGWFEWMTYGVFAFGLIDRALESGRFRYWILLGAVMAWGSFYQADLWLLFTLLSGAYFLFRLWVEARQLEAARRRCWWRQRTLGAALALLSLFAIGLPSFRHALVADVAGREKQIADARQASEDVDSSRWEFVTNWSLPPEDTLEFFKARVHGDTSCPFTLALGRTARSGIRPYTGRLGRPLNAPSGNYRQHSVYVGMLTGVFALCGLVGWLWRKQEETTDVRGMRGTVVFFGIAVFLAYLLSLGRFCEIVYRLVYALPFGDMLRAPVKWHHLTEFSIVALAGFGLEALVRRFNRQRWSIWVLGLLVLVAAIDLARVNRLYCAVQRNDRDYTFASARELAAPGAETYLRQRGIGRAGRIGDLVLLSVPKSSTTPPFVPPPRDSTAQTLGVISLVATLGVAIVAMKGK